MPLTKKGGCVRFDNKIRYIPGTERECLTEDQARHLHKIKEEDNSEANPYQMAILNKVSNDDIKTEQMIHWSILSDLIKYIDGSSDMIPSLIVKPLDYQ